MRGCSLVIKPGDRVLLEGPSGCGKSTFAALLGGLREVGSGLLLVDGFDRHALGVEAWRKRVVTVPQFHENHIFSSTFAFNALMGDEWPPRGDSQRRLYKICKELGLGPLLKKMPRSTLRDAMWHEMKPRATEHGSR